MSDNSKPLPRNGASGWNRAMLGAWRKGYAAFLAGKPCVSPYEDKRKPSGKLSWSRAFKNAWRDGYKEAMELNS